MKLDHAKKAVAAAAAAVDTVAVAAVVVAADVVAIAVVTVAATDVDKSISSADSSIS